MALATLFFADSSVDVRVYETCFAVNLLLLQVLLDKR
jgi:hypothetical protein